MAVVAAAAVTTVGSCGDGEGDGSSGASSASVNPTNSAATAARSGEPWYDDVAPAQAAGKVGPAGSGCTLPVTFDLPPKWRAKTIEPVTGEMAEVADAFTKRGGSTIRCEIDGRPSGDGGFLRVWTSDDPARGPRQALEAFLAAEEEISGQEYRETKVGTLDAVEVSYLSKSSLTDENQRELAMALHTGQGTVLISISGRAFDEFKDFFPAYQLAQQTIAVIK